MVFIGGCSSTFAPKACEADADCGDGLVCAAQGGAPACMEPKDAPIRIGMSAPVSGPSQALGAEMKLGVSLAFDAQNAAGGVRGRSLVLDFRDDAYDPALAEENTRSLLDVRAGEGEPRCPTTTSPAVTGDTPISTTPLERGPDAVLAMLGNVGTPTMVRAAPVSLEASTVFFGAFTGAKKILRDDLAGPCHRWVFNVRASYADEARAALEYFFQVKVPDAAHLVSFDQDDAFGQAGYDGLVAAYQDVKGGFSPPPDDPATPIARFRYQRNVESSVPAQVDAVAARLGALLTDGADHTVGIFMTDTYGPAASFITGLRQWQFANDEEQAQNHKGTRLTLHFVNVSFVGPNALAERLRDAGELETSSGPLPYTDHVLVSQVVPNYESDESDVVKDYKARVAAAGESPGFTSLEGYAAARIFIAGLLAHEGALTPEALVSTFEGLPELSLGLGAQAGFSTDDHDYSKSVWGTQLGPDGAFQNRYFWSEGKALQLFE